MFFSKLRKSVYNQGVVCMNKVRTQVTIPPEVINEVDRHTENRSALITRLLRKYVDMEEAKDDELIEERNRIQEELDDLKEEKENIENRIGELESQLDTIQLALDRKDEEKDMLEEAAEAVAPEWKDKRRKTHDPEEAFEKLWVSEKFGMWEEKIDASREDLKSEVKSIVESEYGDLL